MACGWATSIHAPSTTAWGAEIETYVQSRMAVKRMGRAWKSTPTSAISAPDGEPLRLSTRKVRSASLTLSDGVIQIAASSSRPRPGIAKEAGAGLGSGVPPVRGLAPPHGEEGPETGPGHKFKTFSAEFGKVAVSDVEVEGVDQTVLGKELKPIRVKMKTSPCSRASSS
jgi:hypothetical protein